VIADVAGGVTIEVRVVPRSGRSGVAGRRGDALLVRVHAAPADGAANAEVIEVLAAALGVPKRAVAIVAGDRSRSKRLRVDGIDAAVAAARLQLF
jgi:uncharacterized protein (TIGR00251 family)